MINMSKINRKIHLVVNLLNQEISKKSITTEFKKDLMELIQKHFKSNWKNIEYTEVSVID